MKRVLTDPQFVGFFVSIVGTVITGVIWIVRAINKVHRRLEHIALRIGTVEHQNRALLKAFPQAISSLMGGKLMTREEGIALIGAALEAASIHNLLREIEPSANPLPLQDVNRLRSYVERLKHGHPLTPDEARDFYRLSDIITHEYPSNEGSWLLFLIGGIVLGLMLAPPDRR